ncbi:MAG: bifunctional aconitate hydratase 2/2-methylisocitrate dehydratase [Deferribacterota bacterium]|nr:bifunctional aconitate hydratase 2/2-methylisocitrate dehydratase [Deferribacterota bacterium]
MLDGYLKHVKEREKLGIPPQPLKNYQVQEICDLLKSGVPEDKKNWLIDLLINRVPPGVDEAAKVKAHFLYEVAKSKVNVKSLTDDKAVELLGTMVGGYNVIYLYELLFDNRLAELSAFQFRNIILVYEYFDKIVKLMYDNKYAENIIQSWSDAEWFENKAALPEIIEGKVYKVDGEVNTDDLSPASEAWSRPDIPLHALSMGVKRFPGGIDTIKKFRTEGHKVIFVSDVLGTGSSRKSATNSLLWHIGEDIPYVPNKRNKGIALAGLIAPIFFNTFEDSGGLPIMCDVTKLNTGDIIKINTKEGKIYNENDELMTEFELKPKSLKDEYRAGGRLNLIIGRQLTNKARKILGLDESDVFCKIDNPKPKKGQGYTLAQKIIGKACSVEGVLPGTSCEPKMTTVGSQDTTGPMTADELKELACLKFQTGMFMQSFCHTAAYPKKTDVEMHRNLPEFIISRGGVVLKPGDGIIHSWLNRLLLPDTVGTGGDSHTRFPIGISFPAGSGLVAFAGALGFMPLDVPESVLVKFKGNIKDGITLRDLVNAIPYFAIKKGLLTVEKKNKKNVFNGRIIEIEGLENLTVEQAYELSNSSAERSAAGATISLSEGSIAEYIKSNVALMKEMINEGYQDSETLKRRIDECEAWLDNPEILRRDSSAEYKEILEIDLDEIDEPILACPNDPDDVKKLSEVAGTKIDEVFIGSCMTNIGHFRAAGKIFENENYIKDTKIWLCPPTKMDAKVLKEEGFFNIYTKIGSRIEIPGCSLCMGNQARVAPNTTVISTSTRNFDNRLGDNAKVYLGSAELCAITAVEGKIPDVKKYFEIMNKKVLPYSKQIYKYLEFHKIEGFKLDYA